MNKIGKAMLCTVLTGAMAVGAAGAADLGSLSPQGAKAYLNQITTLQNKYGKAAARTVDGFKGLLTGLSMAKLVDMDGDGTPELYCGAGLDGQHMYSYADGKIYALDIPEGVSNFGTDVSPCADFYVDDTKAYLVDGHEIMNGFPVKYLTKQGRKIVTALTYTDAIDDDTGNHICTLNGESVTYHELSAAQVAFTKGMTWEHYSFWESPYNVPEVRSARASLTDTITSLRTLTNPTAYVSKHKVELNGAKANLAAYTINGSNYFKLRDLAQLLSKTDSRFSVSFDEQSNAVTVVSGKEYTPVGGELARGRDQSKTAVVSKQSVLIDGKAVDGLSIYNSHGLYKISGRSRKIQAVPDHQAVIIKDQGIQSLWLYGVYIFTFLNGHIIVSVRICIANEKIFFSLFSVCDINGVIRVIQTVLVQIPCVLHL